MEMSHMLQVFGEEDAIAVVKKATAELRDAIVERAKGSQQLSEKAKRIKELCVSYGPPGVRMSEICSELLGENITIENTSKKFPYIIFSCIRLKEKVGGHDYAIGDLLFVFISESGDRVTEQIRCLRMNGTVGNWVQATQKSITIPSDDEIESAIRSIFKNAKKEGGEKEEGEKADF